MYCWLTTESEWWQKVNSPLADTFDIDDESNRVDRVSFYVREMPLSDSGLEDKGKSLITESVMDPRLTASPHVSKYYLYNQERVKIFSKTG